MTRLRTPSHLLRIAVNSAPETVEAAPVLGAAFGRTPNHRSPATILQRHQTHPEHERVTKSEDHRASGAVEAVLNLIRAQHRSRIISEEFDYLRERFRLWPSPVLLPTGVSQQRNTQVRCHFTLAEFQIHSPLAKMIAEGSWHSRVQTRFTEPSTGQRLRSSHAPMAKRHRNHQPVPP